MKNIFSRSALAAVGCLAVLVTSAMPSGAVPVFARKYGFNCSMCHSNYPRLNDFGARYRKNGYRLPGRENEEKTILQSPPPVALRTSAGYNYDKARNSSTPAVRQFQLNGLDLLSAGRLSPDAGYIFVYTPQITGSRGVAAQDGVLEMASVIFSRVGSTWFNIRAGRFEPAYAAHSPKRQLAVSPYDIYAFTFPGGMALNQTQSGVEFTGYGRSGASYAAGWVNGSDTGNSSQAASDFYARVEKVFGGGEGQTSGQRIGLMGYSGSAVPDVSLPASASKTFRRAGIDASLNYRHLNLAMQYINGTDNKALWGKNSDVNFSGGLAELSYLPATSLVCFARYDIVDTPQSVNMNIYRWTLGGRYYPADNIALHPEYSYRKQKSSTGDITENFFTARLDYAF
jgi:hypothetical protein